MAYEKRKNSESDFPRRRQQSYSMKDFERSQREYPPMLDSMTDDVDFNAVRDYVEEDDNQYEDFPPEIPRSNSISDSKVLSISGSDNTKKNN